eukprot:COSAG02_NODE_17214_length_1020_cov_22.948969_1_plen_63_part_10
MLIPGSILGMCRIRGDGKKFVSISDLSLNFKRNFLPLWTRAVARAHAMRGRGATTTRARRRRR